MAPWAERFWTAFLELSRERPRAAAPQPIALGALRAWLDEEEIRDPVLRGEFREIVTLLDAAWLERAGRAADDREGPG
ncbi:MAG: hypothetical protein IT561_01975 [Alphaproteobacteria bacterium]|nr:hypothetical protein [Alphaproteobacteria bacterium]